MATKKTDVSVSQDLENSMMKLKQGSSVLDESGLYSPQYQKPRHDQQDDSAAKPQGFFSRVSIS